MSRRHPAGEVYDERHSDYYRSPPPRRPTRDYTELDIDIQRGQQQDLHFLDEEYGGRSATAGPLIVRERAREPLSTRKPPPPRSVEHDEVIVEDYHIHDEPQPRRRRRAEKEEIDVIVRRDEGSVRSAGSRRTAAAAAALPYRERTRDVERDEVVVDHREVRRGGRVVEHEDDIIIRSDERARGARRDERESVHVRHRSRDAARYGRVPSPPSRAMSREREEIVIERRRGARSRSRSLSSSPSPPRRRGTKETEQIIIRRTEQREPSPPPLPEPEPLPPILRAPIHQQIHQEVITHHRHIDHGVHRAYTPSPPPRIATPPRKTEEIIEVDIKRRGRRDGEEEVIVEHDHRSRREDNTALAIRPRSHSLGRQRRRRGTDYDDDLREEADYYNNKAMQRAYIGEAYDGATRDWNIVDVPPGTERVRMDGAGGSSQEITWQRYNGVRRSQFNAGGGREYDSGFGYDDHNHHDRLPEPPMALAPPIQPVPNKMWTEITKDLVLRDAIDAFGYEYEETEFFFYIIEYLRYEEVLQLIELSEDMRQDRRRRIREIEWEREEQRRERKARARADAGERYYEHEVVVDTRRRH